MPENPRRRSGFTLPELLVVSTIIVIIAGGLFVPIQSYLQNARISSTQRTLEQIRDRLVEFAARNGRLPCPADPSSANGVEWMTNTGECVAALAGGIATGVIPWGALQVPEADAWGQRFTYSVQSEWADQTVDANCGPRERFMSFCSSSPAGVSVLTRAQAGGALTSVATQLVAVVLSHGPNVRGGYLQGGIVAQMPNGFDEQLNQLIKLGPNTVLPKPSLVARDPTPGSAGCDDSGGPAFCAFDDRLVMVGRGQLIARMLAEGRTQ